MGIKATPTPNPKPSPETSRRRVSSPFPVGFEVEVRSNEEGFIGSWFEATVTRSLSKFRRYSVTYTTILASSSSSDSPAAPMKDSVHYCMVRPRQPRPDPTRMVYDLYHLVDAYHNDGWWAGVVAGLPGGGMDLYKVRFPTSREEFEFRASELREQMHFVGGNWVSLQGQDVKDGNGMFGVGTRVEISRDSDYYGTTWFVGTILKTIGKKYFLVEYENVRAGCGDTGTLLREIVDLQYIRPPPEMESKKFNVLDEVEAFHGDGWFVATISTILPGPRYIVNFKGQEGIKLADTSVRPRCRWTGRRWVSISQVKHSKSPTARGAKSASHGLKSNGSKSSNIEDNDEVVNESNFVMSKRKGADGASPERQIESPNVVKKPKKVNVSQQNCRLADDMVRKFNSENETNETMAMKGSYSADLISECIPALTNRHLPEGESPSEKIVTSHGESKGKVSKHHFNATCLSPSSLGHEVSDSIPTAEWQIGKGVRSPNTRQRIKRLVIRRKTNIDVDVREHAEEETMQRKRDKIQQTRIINIPDSPQEIRGLEVTGIIAREGRGDEVGICNQSISIDLPPNDMQPYQQEVMECISPRVQPSSHHYEATGKRSSLIANSEGNSQSSSSTFSTNKQGNFSDNGYLTPEMVSIRIENPQHSTTQLLPCSLATCFNQAREMQSRTVELNGIKTKEQTSPFRDCILHGGNELVPSMLTSEKAVTMKNSQLSSNTVALPFTKKSPYWEMIESDGAFQIVSQQPHFCPLEQHLMEFREGMAIGLMTTFTDLVAEIRRLGNIDSPQKFEDKLKALDSLESNGFDVQFLRSHTTRLLEMTSRLRQSESERIELKARLSDKAAQKQMKKDEHYVLDKVIFDLEENLARLLESRASVVSEMDIIDSEICDMERDVQAAEEAFVSATVQFNSSLVTTW